MGTIVSIKDYPPINSERNIEIHLISPIIIEKIELVRNNIVILRKKHDSKILQLTYLDQDLFDTISLISEIKNEKFVFYYVRVFLAQNHMAWSSPIWIIKKN